MVKDAVGPPYMRLCCEDLTIGQRFRTIGRTVTEADIVNFINCTGTAEVLFMSLDFMSLDFLAAKANQGPGCRLQLRRGTGDAGHHAAH
jgi:hypothetical protein